MSYVVLARKYRPKNFSELVGQQHVVRALTNALNNNRLHHAYLLTGTRGVGKTTLGRILAKCLNCETGISSTPCEQCASCIEINAGQSLDLIEIDAASNTKVEDTRDLLDNVQYAASRDRFKIYLIDEVHMLSGHSFNALLKTLEEPPEHVKFILATTDPQKLPITVLSRCLQFNLRAMPATQISGHLADVMTQEKLVAEPAALLRLAHAADGSMRDALSLLDQAIAFSDNNVTEHDVHTMLGDIEQRQLFDIITALQQQNVSALFQAVDGLANQAVDYQQALEGLLSVLHQVALAQTLAEAINQDIPERETILNLATTLSQEEVQLYYQIALIGRRDLPLAPAPRAGFEMVLLRMLSFSPNAPQQTPATTRIEKHIKTPTPSTKITEAPKPALKPVANNNWDDLINQANLNGITKVLASHCALKSIDSKTIELEVDPSHAAIASEPQRQKLQAAMQQLLNSNVKITIHKTTLTSESPAKKTQRVDNENRQNALDELNDDPNVQDLIAQFGANIETESITTLNEE